MTLAKTRFISEIALVLALSSLIFSLIAYHKSVNAERSYQKTLDMIRSGLLQSVNTAKENNKEIPEVIQDFINQLETRQ
jgi:hypothetical protein